MYSPKIKEEHIPRLYRMGKKFHRPMTYLVNEAIEEYLVNKQEVLKHESEPVVE